MLSSWSGPSSTRKPRAFRREFSKKNQGFARVAKRKLDQLQAAAALADLAAIPGNRLEALSGERRGQYSVRINGQSRICFRWIESDAIDVEIADCH
jgi:proteic killer suppression protein